MAGRPACAIAWGLAALFLAAPSLRAEDGRAPVPIVSRADGTRAWVEISRSADGAKAVPVVYVPRAAVRGAVGGAEGRTVQADLPGGAWNEIEAILERHRAAAAKRPGAISVGAARDLVSEIRHALARGNAVAMRPDGSPADPQSPSGGP